MVSIKRKHVAAEDQVQQIGSPSQQVQGTLLRDRLHFKFFFGSFPGDIFLCGQFSMPPRQLFHERGSDHRRKDIRKKRVGSEQPKSWNQWLVSTKDQPNEPQKTNESTNLYLFPPHSPIDDFSKSYKHPEHKHTDFHPVIRFLTCCHEARVVWNHRSKGARGNH